MVLQRFPSSVIRLKGVRLSQRDPLEHVRRLLVDNSFADAAELKKLEKVRPSRPAPLDSLPAFLAGLLRSSGRTPPIFTHCSLACQFDWPTQVSL